MRHFLATVCVIAFASSVFGEVVEFIDDFDGPNLNPQLEDVQGTYTLSGGSAFPTAGRSYVRTVSNDLAEENFIAELIYTQTIGGGPAGVFFGIGRGQRNPFYFNEPVPSIFMGDLATDFSSNGVLVGRWADTTSVSERIFRDDSADFSGLAKMRIEKIGDAIAFAGDFQFDGTSFDPQVSQTFSLSNDAPFLDNTNSHVFFGTDVSPTRFHSFSIQAVAVPEPTALPALVLAGLTMACRRRTRS